jgi:glycosyltransferase involved in cell wall biosynthesis
LISLARPIKEATGGRPVCVTLQGEDLFISGLADADRRDTLELIRANVRHVDAFISVSDYYAGFMRELLDIPAEKMRVVPLGINLEGYAPRETATTKKRGAEFVVGYFGRVAPEKGLHVLAEAYQILRAREDFGAARLEVGGYLAPEHNNYLHGIERGMKDAGLAGEFHYRGALDRDAKIEFLRGLDVFSLPATYDEPKGLSLLEASACGVPLVVPRRGAFTEVVERTSGGLLVEPDDATALAEGILAIKNDPARAAELGRAGAAGVRAHYSVARMADRALEVYAGVSGKMTGDAKNDESRASQSVVVA